jgi:hypothetical protein
VISKPIALIQIPNQRLFSTKAAAQYLGVHPDSLRKYSDLGLVTARKLERRRVFTLEDLDVFIESLPPYSDYGTNDTVEDPVGNEGR